MLFDRDDELEQLDRLVRSTSGGDAAVCAIEGPAGIGKSRLLAAVRERASEHGMQVLAARASDFEQGFGFGVVRQLLEPAAQADLDGSLSGAAAPARAILGGAIPGEEEGADPDPSFATLHGLFWLTVRLAEQQPLLLAVDDLQWCDVASLRFLVYLRARFEGLPILLVCAARDAERGDGGDALGLLLGDPAAVQLRPRALSERATALLIEQRLGDAPDPPFSTACHRATGGNPLLLEELVKVLAAEAVSPDAAHLEMLKDLGPAAVRRTVFLRLGRLGADAAAAAQALAVLGDGVDLALLAAFADLEIERAGRATSALAAAEIIRPGSPLGFVHPLVAAAIYRDLLPGAVDLLHLRAAELLLVAGARAEQVAGHLVRAPVSGRPWALDQLVAAATEATRRGADDSGVSYLQRALAEPLPAEHRAELLAQLGAMQARVDGAAAAQSLRAAHDLIVEPERRADIAERLGWTLFFTGRADDARQVVGEAAAALPTEHLDLHRRLEAFDAACDWLAASGPGALRHLRPHRTGPADGLGAKRLAAVAAGAWMLDGGPSDAVAARCLELLADGELVRQDPNWAAMFLINTLVLADREEAEAWSEAATAAAYRHGSLTQITGITVWRANALHRRGELADAELSAREALMVAREWGFSHDSADVLPEALLASVLRDRGNLAEARRALGSGPEPGRRDEYARQWHGSRIELLLAEGRHQETVAEADEYAHRYAPIAANATDVPWRSIKAQALDRLGRRREAIALAHAELDLARAWGAPGTVARSLRTLGSVEGEAGIAHLEEAVDVVAGSPARLEHAKALCALGTALRRERRPAVSRAPLRQALELASACGAERLATQARTELYAAGGRPRRTALAGVESLTASERRVVDLAAAGRTNREIGEMLFVAPKTVAMHLSNAYRKLGLTSRRELAAALTVAAP
ncbi:MAG: hypothetical protein QOE63_1244 [Acidimicrobiaceae bacterium]